MMLPQMKAENTSNAQINFNRARRGIVAVVSVRLAYTWIAIAILGAYLTLVFGFDFVFKDMRWPMTAAVVAGFGIGLALTLWRMRRILRFFNLKNKEPDLRDIDLRLVRDCLNAPIAIAAIDLVSWIVAGSAVTLYLMVAQPEASNRIFVHGFISNLYAGQLVAIFNFYALELILSRRVWPYLLQHRRISEIPGVIPVPLIARMGIFVVTTSICPMGFFYLLEWVGDGSGIIMIAAILTTLVNGVWQGANLGFAYSRPLGRLAGKFERLRKNGPTDERTEIYRADAIGRLAEMFDDLVDTMQERDFIRTTFGRYMSQQVVDRILNGEFELGGSRYEATVLFTDIRGFTTISESREPEEIVAFLNDYLDRMVQAIVNHNGIPDKFIGDGILAVWGVPGDDAKHAENAVRAALAMIEALADFNRGRSDSPVRIGVGIHSGPLIAGNIGSKKKMEFTVIGDTVNTCSRIEALNKQLGTTLAISGETHKRLPAELQTRFEAKRDIEIRGRSGKTEILTLSERP